MLSWLRRGVVEEAGRSSQSAAARNLIRRLHGVLGCFRNLVAALLGRLSVFLATNDQVLEADLFYFSNRHAVGALWPVLGRGLLPLNDSNWFCKVLGRGSEQVLRHLRRRVLPSKRPSTTLAALFYL